MSPEEGVKGIRYSPMSIESVHVTRTQVGNSSPTADANEVPRTVGAPARPRAAQTPVPTPTLTGATASWLALTFALSYVAIPSATVTVGVVTPSALAYGGQYPAFICTAILTTAIVGLVRPRVRLDAAGHDPFWAATAGGLAMWLLLQNVVQMPMAWLSGWPLISLFATKLLELSMLSMMFASYTRRPGTAAALSAGFQLGTFLLTVVFLFLV